MNLIIHANRLPKRVSIAVIIVLLLTSLFGRDVLAQAPKKVERTEQQVAPQNAEEQLQQQGLIEAQINDVFSTAEFVALERAALQQPSTALTVKKGAGTAVTGTLDPSTTTADVLLNQLDGSDLMDYVAEDDLWKEQLTIEDEP